MSRDNIAGMIVGKEWKWPTSEELVEWEAKIKRKHTRAIGPGNQLMLIRCVRSQRRVIEKLVRMLTIATEAPAASPAAVTQPEKLL